MWEAQHGDLLKTRCFINITLFNSQNIVIRDGTQLISPGNSDPDLSDTKSLTSRYRDEKREF